MTEVALGLGSNVGDPVDNLGRALERLARNVEITRVSSLYRTEPVGVREQPHFLNVAALGRVGLDAHALLAEITSVEEELGRLRDVPMGPRTIDIDLLLFGEAVVCDAELVVPHPRMAERRFVLAPLAEIAPELRPPGWHHTVSEALGRLGPGASVERLESADWPPEIGPI